MLARIPWGRCRDADFHHVVRQELQARACRPVLEQSPQRRGAPAEEIQHGGGDQVVDTCEGEAAVDEEKDEEDGGGEEVRGFEELVVAVADRTERHEG